MTVTGDRLSKWKRLVVKIARWTSASKASTTLFSKEGYAWKLTADVSELDRFAQANGNDHVLDDTFPWWELGMGYRVRQFCEQERCSKH